MPLTKVKSLGITDGAVIGADIADSSIALSKLSATGTASASTFLRGDNSWGSAGATAGQVIQVLSATDSTARSSTSTSFVTASNTLSVTITPSSTSNKIFIISNFNIHTTANETYAEMTIFRGATNLNSVNSNYGMGRIWSRVDSRPVYPMAISYLDSPNTTSATTYQIYFRAAPSGTVYLGGLDSGSIASITCMEIKG